ncbi:hypothetical protein KTF36_17955 [Burkholderia gladioli]|uniref:hypothetical protein n=1 Tax=Burkholderia gladioli TaxID=28095 RepID=UPI001C2497ED|nr:hypothetical protein [Burkholderia gladioli]MBU9643737.1 hypothetical protein [Burkholderia gladioli]
MNEHEKIPAQGGEMPPVERAADTGGRGINTVRGATSAGNAAQDRNTNAVALTDDFRGNDANLVRSIEALIALNDEGALVPHGIGGLARVLLSAAAVRLTSPRAAVPRHVLASLECTAVWLEKGNDPQDAARELRACLAKIDAAPAAPVADEWDASQQAYIESLDEPAQAVAADGASTQRCNLGVGCDEAGVCYASAHGDASQCGRAAVSPATADERAAFEKLRGQMAYIAAYSTDELDSMDRDRLWGRCHAIIVRAKRAIAELCASQAAAPASPDWRHIANEWADVATNGIQAVKNVRDGVDTAEEAIARLVADIERCRALPTQAAARSLPDDVQDTLKLAIGYIGSSERADRHEHVARIQAILVGAAQAEAREPSRVGRADIVDGRVQSFAFEQTDIPTGSYSLYTAPISAPADAGEAVAFIRDVAAQKPEKPDHWSSCGQCEHNRDRAQDLLDAVQGAQGGKGGDRG